jgi:hypothetical protein
MPSRPGRGNRELWWLCKAFDTAGRLDQPVAVYEGFYRTNGNGPVSDAPIPYHVRSLWARAPRGARGVAVVSRSGAVLVTDPAWRNALGLSATAGRFV